MRTFHNLSKLPQDERGNSIVGALVMSFIFLSLSVTLLTSVQNNRSTVDNNMDKFHAKQAAITGMNIAIDQINDFVLNEETTLSFSGGKFAILGNARSRSDPNVMSMNLPGSEIRPGSIEDTVMNVISVPYEGVPPVLSEVLKKENGFFYVQAERLADDSWKLRIRGKWRNNVKRFMTILVRDEGNPFSIGVYGASGVVVDGPGLIDWINSEDLNDETLPIVLESGGDLTIVKDPLDDNLSEPADPDPEPTGDDGGDPSNEE